MKGKAKHTPGPWHRNIPPATKYVTVYAGRNTHVTYVATQYLTPEEVEANINLIAAAPELLERLKQAVEMIKDLRNEHHTVNITGLNATIAKAEGEKYP